MNITTLASLILLTISMAAPRPRNHHSSSRELAELVAQFPGTSLEILREVRDNIRRTQAGIKLVIKMERELRRTARDIRDEMEERGDVKNIVKRSDNQQSFTQPPPFSAWAG